MSAPDDTAPRLPQPVPATTATAEDGAPYRVPAPPVEPPEPEVFSFAPPRKPRPIIGPALSTFAIVLWTFVVVGQFTTSWPLGTPISQGAAAVLLVGMTFLAWAVSLRRSRVVLPPRSIVHFVGRGLGIAALAWILFVVTLVAATAAGEMSSRNHDMLIALVLLFLSLGAAIAGPKVTSPAPPERTHRERSMLAMLWIAGTLLTLVTAVDLAVHG
jgi:hypothetical protein